MEKRHHYQETWQVGKRQHKPLVKGLKGVLKVFPDFSEFQLLYPVFLRQAAKSSFQLKCFNEGVTEKFITVV